MPVPPPLFNPILAPEPLNWIEILGGPLGLAVCLLLAPLARIVGIRSPLAALIGFGLIWTFGTAGPAAGAVLLVAIAAATACLLVLIQLRRSGSFSERGMIVATWIGMTLMVLPLWWWPQWSWYAWKPSRLPVLHNLGFAYFYLRFIAWGVDWARSPERPLEAARTIAWLLYPPIMRLGPVLARERFFERLDAWQPRAVLPWRELATRFALFAIGITLLLAVSKNTPNAFADKPDYFAAPELYATRVLVRAFYFVPLQIYLILWTYNELAAVVALLVGIRVDNNFDWLPAATSVRDFWRRWHITVGAWLRTYIYIPLGGNRSPSWITYTAVFGFCGVWHGASWSFLVWGLSQAAALCVQKWWDLIWMRGTEALRHEGTKGADGSLRSQSDTAAGRSENRRQESAPTAAAVQNPRSKIQNRAAMPSAAGLAWTGLCWLLTMHYQAATILAFADFDHWGTRLIPELLRRLLSGTP